MPELWEPDSCDCAILQDNKTGEQISDPKFNHLVKKCTLHKDISTANLKQAITQHRINKGLIDKPGQSETQTKLINQKRKTEKLRIRKIQNTPS